MLLGSPFVAFGDTTNDAVRDVNDGLPIRDVWMHISTGCTSRPSTSAVSVDAATPRCLHDRSAASDREP